MGKDLATRNADTLAKARTDARDMLGRFIPRAIEVMTEIMELGENDRVRLSAANSVLDRAGVTPPPEAPERATDEEKALVREEVTGIMERLAANVKAQQERDRGGEPIKTEVIMIHESETEELSSGEGAS